MIKKLVAIIKIEIDWEFGNAELSNLIEDSYIALPNGDIIDKNIECLTIRERKRVLKNELLCKERP